MFFEELTPLGQEFMQQPIAFMGGVLAGALRLNLNEDPLKSWLEEQGGQVPTSNPSPSNSQNGGPQSINIQ
ncbi:hypothetical protein PN462_12910 [Spirulina sp. CS-785/01]|uniref:hypothetical protein n=1 Tax=Spirulina sp. CS-785/01 TaxID=3021716 RepID=UPI00232FE358|nr:hypothetical protein [Spirulina sp. CS-785/01]MDB9314006.1 hypothetical protein [Spirulina sp. CS-785/01]